MTGVTSVVGVPSTHLVVSDNGLVPKRRQASSELTLAHCQLDAQVQTNVLILPRIPHTTRSIPNLMMPWLHVSLGHQQSRKARGSFMFSSVSITCVISKIKDYVKCRYLCTSIQINSTSKRPVNQYNHQKLFCKVHFDEMTT